MVEFDMCRKKRPAHVDERAVSKASCTKCSSCPAASAYKGIKNPPILQENEWRKIAFNFYYVSAQNPPFVQPFPLSVQAQSVAEKHSCDG